MRTQKSMSRFVQAVLVCLVVIVASPSWADTFQVASFNIQFLGHFKNRDNEALAELMAPYDLVFVQEVVAPPGPGYFPDGEAFRPDKESRDFFEAMEAQGFSYLLSEEDTGTKPENHNNGPATEWFVAFYKPARACPALHLPHGFLATDRTDHADYERVPYAFPFQVGTSDLVFVSVHLNPGGGKKDTARRAHELETIFKWIDSRPGQEKDYVVLGDMNIEDCEELAAVLAPGFASLNDQCLPTNTNLNKPKPYDHVMYNVVHSKAELLAPPSFKVIDLIEEMRGVWGNDGEPYPGDPYDHDSFRQFYSDHHPVAFSVSASGSDDD